MLTLDITDNDQNVWKDIKAGAYSIVLVVLKMLLESHLRFWLSTIRNRANLFY